MKDSIKGLSPDKAKNILNDIMDVYFEKGFGVMNKTEIETLLYYVFKKHELLSGKCFDDSFLLKIPEAKARKLNYEAQVKYDDRSKDALQAYLRKSIGECLTHAFVINKNHEIKFAIEDKYLRIALNAKLREHHYFADTSFNTDIISMHEDAFKKMIHVLVPNFKREEIEGKLNLIEVENNEDPNVFVSNFITEAFKQMCIDAIVQVGKVLIATAI